MSTPMTPYLIKELVRMNGVRRLMVSVSSRRSHLPSPLSYSIYTRSNELVRPKSIATWTDRIKRWNSDGKDSNKEAKDSDKEVSEGSESSESNESCANVDALKVKDEKINELKDKYMRALAETENVRQRLNRQVDEAKKFGIQNFAKELLDVADILEKANESISQKDMESDNKTLLSLVDGLKLTELELQKVFKKNGVVKVDSKGDMFDPAIHEALFEVPGDKPGTVAVVSRLGYMLHDRTLRPARVGVVKAES